MKKSPIDIESIDVTIETLRRDRQLAISQHNYKKAQQLEDEITNLKGKKKRDDTTAKQLANANNLEKEKSNLKRTATAIQSDFIQRVYETRLIYQKRYTLLLNKQEEEVRKLATDFAKNIEYAQIRRVPEHVELMRVSQLKADASQYAVANQMSSEAEYIRSITLQQRHDEVHMQYQKQQDALIRSQQAETAGHLKKLNNDLNLIRCEFKKEIGKLKKALITHGITFGITVSEQEAEEFFAPYEIIDDEEQNTPVSTTNSSLATPSPSKTPRTRSIASPSPRSPRTPRSGLRSPLKSPKYRKSPVSK
ncbi:hypothetical protein TRFO_14643 [Tritrichomonas foetus]|uniref:Uncharacterized protein n=1 Tax=Tritrichomonas foetus TaxID=1144522 RepID=A0A1J4KVQ7_9EUKA|nr:hypothetical protein TRFO_14643 [Tritrichomonas foetus]|eukprot:OHT14976.1 hypothetical protein TRFO_14643 [Tritrichomonas foetus]